MNEQEHQDRFENEHMCIRYKKKPGCLIKLDISVKKEALLAAYEKAVKDIKKEVSLPGFRKGKVPTDMLSKKFAEAIDKQFRSILLDISFREGSELVKRPPFGRRSVRKAEIRSLDKTSGAELLFEYEATPSVPQIDAKALELQFVPPKEITEKELNDSRLRLRLMHAEKRPADDRELRLGDLAHITLLSSDEAHAHASSEYYMDPKFVAQWLLEAALGMKKGEKKEIVIPQEDRCSSCTETSWLQLDSIDECTLPEENDEFAQKVKAGNQEDLIQKLKSRLEYETKFKAFEQMRLNVRNELIRLYAFDLPQSLIEGETEARLRPYIDSLVKKHTSFDKESLKKEFTDEVKRYFTLLFLLQPLASRVELKVEQSEVLEELAHQMIHAPYETRYIYPQLPEEDAHQRLLMALLIRKCEDRCIEERLGVTPPTRA